MRFKYLRYILSAILIIGAVFVIYSKLKVSYSDIPLLFKEANKFFLVFLIASQGLCLISDGWLSKILLRIAGFNINLRDTIMVAILGVLGGQVAPFIGGTILTFYFYKKLKLPSSAILFLITSWTVFTTFFYFFFFIISLFFIPESYFFLIPQNVIIIIPIISVALLIFGYSLLKNQGKNLISFINFLVKLINKIRVFFRKKETVASEKLRITISDFYNNFNLLKVNMRKIPILIMASLLFFSGNIATLYFSFLVFGFHANLAILIFGLTISLILTVFTLAPETPGIMEASLAIVFLSLGFPSHITLFSVLLYRIFSYWLPLPFGVFAYFKLKSSDKMTSSVLK